MRLRGIEIVLTVAASDGRGYNEGRVVAMRVAQRLGLAVAVLATTSIACVHAREGVDVPRAAGEKVIVTGSHIPQRVDPRTGVVATMSPLRVYSRQQLDDTGRQTDLAAALRWLDPTLQ